MVTVENPSDKTSARRVDPIDLAAVYGEGYRLSKVILVASDEPVSRDLGKRLPFVDPPPSKTGIWGGDQFYVGSFELTITFYRWSKHE